MNRTIGAGPLDRLKLEPGVGEHVFEGHLHESEPDDPRVGLEIAIRLRRSGRLRQEHSALDAGLRVLKGFAVCDGQLNDLIHVDPGIRCHD